MPDGTMVLGVVLGEQSEAIDDFLARCASRGVKPLLLRPTFETALPDHPAAATIRSPMDYLGEEAIDEIYADLDRMQRRLPSIVLSTGIPVAEWGTDLGLPPTVWAWLPALVPYWHVTLRLVRTIRRVVEVEAPAEIELLGGDELSDWTRPIISAAFRTPRSETMRNEAESAAATLPQRPRDGPTRWNFEIPDRIADRVTRVLADRRAEFARRAPGPFTGHVMLLMRGVRGTAWLRSRTTRRTSLVDEYSEGMPEALVERCRAVGARLTIVYEGELPGHSTVRPSYAATYPGTVCEVSTNDFAAIASAMRADVRTRTEVATSALLADPAFSAAFILDGIDVFEQFHDYIQRSIVNLSTLAVTQYHAWKFFLEHNPADVVVGGRLEAKPWVSRAAHDLDRQTMSIKLGIGEEMMPSMIAIDHRGDFAHRDYPDAFLVWGERQRVYLAERLPGYRGLIRAVGRARSDTFVREAASIDARAQRRLLGLPEDARLIVYGANHRSRYGQWPGVRWGSSCFSRESWVACFRALVEVAHDLGDGFVLVKPHPADDLEFIADLVRREGGDHVRLITSDMGFHNVEILAACDAFVSTVTSMFAEALIMGRVSINIWRPDVNLLYEKARWTRYSAIAAPVDDFAAMKALLMRLLTDEDAYRAEVERGLAEIRDYFGGLDGLNASRAAETAVDTAVRACEPMA
ncbi:MAG: CDP-glycerol glycerophosphotransferase family protein [Siculibacillus sp.]|nr:CDP-glycerol glycerophosphotransferase family protein [Siculibacillus sp.]